MKTIKILLFILCVSTQISVKGQGANFVWAQRFGGNLNDNCWSGCDQTGNVYRLQGNSLTKHSSSGSPLWNITTAYSFWEISFDQNQDIFLNCSYTGTVDLDHGPGTQSVISIGAIDRALVKLSATNGDFIWGGSAGSVGNDYEGVIANDANGNLYSGIYFTGVYDADPSAAVQNFTASATDFLVSKIDASGNLVWAKQFASTSNAYVSSMDINSAGEVFLSGSFNGTLDFDPGAGVNNLSSSSNTDFDMYFSKLDASGNPIWVKQIGNTGLDYGSHLKLGTNGNIYCSGQYTGLVDFDSGAGTMALNSGTTTQGYVVEFNASGTPNWVKSLIGYSATDMALDLYNGICLTGQYRAADFNPGAGTFSLTANGGTWPDIYISKLNSNGDFLWAKTIGSLNEDGPNTITIDGTNAIHVAGRFKTTCDFDPNGGYYPLTANGGNFNYDGFMLKLCQTPDLASVIGNAVLCADQTGTYSVTAPPNAVSYVWTLPVDWTGSSTTNSISITPGSTGSLSVKIGNACGYSPVQSLSVSVEICTGIKSENLNPAYIYPNPSNGDFYIESLGSYNTLVFNNLGKIVHSATIIPGKNLLELHDLAKGIYLLELSNTEGRFVHKIVVE